MSGFDLGGDISQSTRVLVRVTADRSERERGRETEVSEVSVHGGGGRNVSSLRLDRRGREPSGRLRAAERRPIDMCVALFNRGL